MSAASIGTHAAWGIIALLSVGVGGYALFHVFTGFEKLPLTNPMFSPYGLQLHIAASAVAMILGAFQFLRVLRQKAPGVHRWLGRFYIASCLIGGAAGGSIALSSTAGPVAGWGFFMLAIIWLFATVMAWAAALRRDFTSHERWMIRSFALTLAAVTLRLYLPASIVFDLEFVTAYTVIAWICWVPNLIIAEIWIAMRKRPRRPKVAPAEAPA
ncbi:MAG TPA: DUF2306 domain-containing protein [Hyphomonadaceae bacterium]